MNNTEHNRPRNKKATLVIGAGGLLCFVGGFLGFQGIQPMMSQAVEPAGGVPSVVVSLQKEPNGCEVKLLSQGSVYHAAASADYICGAKVSDTIKVNPNDLSKPAGSADNA